MNESTEYEFNTLAILESLDCGDPYLRRNFIGASDAPIIMGDSTWRTPLQLYREKIGLDVPQCENYAMTRGKEMENEARNKVSEILGIELKPKRFFSDKYEWMMASLDAINVFATIAVEIKCPGQVSHQKALEGLIPECYFAQLQHQMYVAKLNKIYYFSYRSDLDFILLECARDDFYIKRMIDKEIEFVTCMKSMIEPELTEMDFEAKSDIGWIILSNEWKSIQRSKKEVLEREEQVRKELIAASKDRNCRGFGIRVQKIHKKGTIDYSSVVELKGIDLEKYRKEKSEYWKISFDGEK